MSGDKPRSIESILDSQPWTSLRKHLPSSGEREAVIAKLREFCRRAIEWNRSVSNLLARNDEPRIVERHVLESLQPATWMIESGASRWLDFGSGAGFPAIVLAIAGVGTKWELVESRRPKALFLRRVSAELGLGDRVEVHHSRLELLLGSLADMDGFTSRAVTKLGPTLEIAESFLRPDGICFLWKGSQWQEEIARSPLLARWSIESRALEAGRGVVLKAMRSSV